MTYSVELFPAAIEEIEESASWYEKAVEGLGIDFIHAIYRSFDAIALNPFAYPKKKGYGEFVVKRFPFLIVYEVLEKEATVNILHVFHTSRNPRLKNKRT